MDKQHFRIDILAVRHQNIITRVLNLMFRKRIEVNSVWANSDGIGDIQRMTVLFTESKNTAENICAQIGKCVDVFSTTLTEEKLTNDTRRRTLIHPGKYNPVRMQVKFSSACNHLRITLPPYTNFHDAIVNPLREIGIENAIITIFGGFFKSIFYCVAPPDPLKRAVIAYSDPIDAGASYMVTGNATLGKSINREPLIHCHAALLSSDNKVTGGHIIVDRCVVGSYPIFAQVASFQEINVIQKWDPETNILLLQPQEKE